MIVRVMGFGRAVRIAFEDVFVRMDAENQAQHSPTSLYDTGAFNDSAISCAFSLMLAFLPLTVRMASVKLFCLPCLAPLAIPFAQELQVLGFDSFLNGQRALECMPIGNPFIRGAGLGPRDMSSTAFSFCSLASCTKSGNLNVFGAAWLDEERLRSCPEVAWGTMI